jgi:hypothetical protein
MILVQNLATNFSETVMGVKKTRDSESSFKYAKAVME